jgi:diguanylate cyclase (GGDEF)-like protein
MPQSFIKLHTALLSVLLFMLVITFIIVFNIGTLKPLTDIDWVDSVGEGGIAFMTLIWLLVTLVMRPKGNVTNLLFLGLSTMHITLLLDFLDEFFIFSKNHRWLSSLEAFPAVIGMFLMSLAMYYWSQEQRIINQLLTKKERFYRTHGLHDFITGLYRAEYMKRQIQQEITSLSNPNYCFSIALFDIKGFALFNQRYGSERANNLLFDIGQIITLNLRNSDLACRFASDRFIVLFPNTNYLEATHITEQVANMVAQHTPYDQNQAITGFSKVNWYCLEAVNKDSLDTLFTKLNQGLEQQKETSTL